MVDEEAAAALRRVGVKEADIEAALAQEVKAEVEAEAEAEPKRDDFEVYEDCWESVLFFLKVQTQWLYVGMGGRAGLDSTAVEATMRMTGVKRAAQAALLADLQVMEREVLKADGERTDKAAG